MRKFLLQLFWFGLPVLFIFGFLEYKISAIPNDLSYKRVLLEAALPKIEVLITGASDSFMGINPQYFSKVGFNLAFHSQSLIIDTQLVRKYFDRMPRLQLIIMSINYATPSYKMSDSDESRRNFLYSRFFGIRGDQSVLSLLHPQNYFAFMNYGSNQIREFIEKKFKVNLASETSASGWSKSETIGNAQVITVATGKKLVLFHDRLMKSEHIPDNLKALDDLLSYAAPKDVKIVFVTPPVFNTYSSLMNLDVWQKEKTLIRNLAQKHNTFYYDFLTDSRFEISDFKDDNHLNFKGAEKLSQILEVDVVRPNTK